MENGDITDSQLSASDQWSTCPPSNGRLNMARDADVCQAFALSDNIATHTEGTCSKALIFKSIRSGKNDYSMFQSHLIAIW